MEVFSDIRFLSLLGFGFLLGLKHALDIDHIVAVSTIVSERKSFFRSTIIGTLWGIGHTAALLVVGTLVLYFDIQVSETVAAWMELGVACVLIGLGIHLLVKIRRGAVLHVHVHQHHQHLHFHPHIHEPSRENDFQNENHHNTNVGKKPLLVGVVHGLAGSAAIMLIVLTSISSQFVGLLYIMIFGIGSIVGMAVVSIVVSIPVFFASKHANIMKRVQIGAAMLSIIVGLLLGGKIAFSLSQSIL